MDDLSRSVGGGSSFSVVAHTVSAALAPSDAGKLHTNTGAGAEVVLTLPAWSSGRIVEFACADAQFLRVLNLDNTTIIALGADGFGGGVSVSGGYVRSNKPTSYLRLVGAAAGVWAAGSLTGAWDIDS